MSMERAALRGHLEVAKKRIRELKVEGSGIRTLLRDKLAPWQDVTALDGEQISVHTNRLVEIIEECKRLNEQVAQMEDELNG